MRDKNTSLEICLTKKELLIKEFILLRVKSVLFFGKSTNYVISL